MPFNSSDNNYGSTHTSKENESFQFLRNSYNIAQEGFTHIPQQDLIYRPIASVQQYILPADNSSSVSYYNDDELRYINHEKLRRRSPLVAEREELRGEGIGKLTKNIKKKATKTGNTIKKSTVNKNGTIHQIIEKSLDYAIPLAAEAVGAAASTYLTGDPTSGAALGKAAGEAGRDKLHSKTGYGDKPSEVGIGKYEKNIHLDKIIDKYARQAAPKQGETYKEHPSDTPYTPLPKKRVNNSLDERNKLVHKVMKERNLSLPQASKYVKDNNLYKK